MQPILACPAKLPFIFWSTYWKKEALWWLLLRIIPCYELDKLDWQETNKIHMIYQMKIGKRNYHDFIWNVILKFVSNHMQRDICDSARLITQNRAWEEPVRGRRSRGRQKIRWRDKMKDDMEHRGLAEEDALDRKEWRRRIRQPTPWSREAGEKEEASKVCIFCVARALAIWYVKTSPAEIKKTL